MAENAAETRKTGFVDMKNVVWHECFKQLLHLGEGKPKEKEAGGDDEDGKTAERVKGRQEMRKDKQRSISRKEEEERKGKPSVGGFAEIKTGQEKFIGAILTGLHRALPYAAQDTAL